MTRAVSLLASMVLSLAIFACAAGEMPAPAEPVVTDSVVDAPAGPPRFEDYPATVAHGLTPAAVDLASHATARRFRTMLTRGAAEGPNFAGRYTVVTWGCGTMCQQLMVVDAQSGRVFDGLEASLGFEYRLESRLLVVNPAEAVRENPCPTCTTRYHLWEDERFVKLADGSTPGGAEPPLARRDLVLQVRAEEAPALLAGSAQRAVRESWDRLIIAAGDGSRHVFQDEVVGDDLRWIHRYVGYLEGIGAHVMERRYVPEGGEFLLVEGRTGRTTPIDAAPAASPDGQRFITASLDLVAGHSPNRLRIYRMEANGPLLEWEHEPREWGAHNPRWVDGSTIELERGVIDWNTHELHVSPLVLRREPGGWGFQPSPEHAADALLSFFSALANQRYPEAVRLYGGSYEVLRGWNPDHDPADLTGLWQLACGYNGLQCLGRAEIVRGEQVSRDDHRFVVRFYAPSGELFVLGPCCGATAEEMPPQSEFAFAVHRVGDRYLVQDLPVYVP
jgi:hypothetical protein